VLLAGDAGGFVNGFTAEGIYYAMVSGELAARTVAASWPSTAADLSEPYRRAVDQEMGAELRDSVLVQRYLFGDRRRIAAAIATAPHQNSMTKLILDLAVGRRSYPDVRRRIFARLPLLAARLLWQRTQRELGNWVIGESGN
jgi:flavin-dependent dehydrogenase